MHALYIVGSHLAFLLAAPVLWLSPKLRRGWWQRLGRGYRRTRDDRHCVWLHGASAGDLLALRPIVIALKSARPDLRVVVSSTTESGREMVMSQLPDVDDFLYQPFDLWGPVGRALDAVRPRVLVLEYTELWPQLTRSADRRGIDLVLTNGRLSPSQMGRYQILFRVIGNPLSRFRHLLMRSPIEAERAIALGAPVDRVQAAGSTKFDNLKVPDPVAVDRLRSALGLESGRPVWVCGSTHEGEEGPLIDVFRRLRDRHPDLALILAPRYTERSTRVAQISRLAGFEPRLRSEGPDSEIAVWILDQVGELSTAYGLADLVFVGGSFVPRGGQNILEPAACAKPVLFGPGMENFVEAVELLLGRGGLQVDDFDVLEQTLDQLLKAPEQARKTGRLAADAVAGQQGAAQRCADVILSCLEPLDD
ncbi:MAG TPA: 3-deoxy-D-manno-octulosonic acid transferase [Myxococcales bacterium]|nr:3-deoxy-D-manno-octulosonic acid transferase [Myxococcales bacterium]